MSTASLSPLPLEKISVISPSPLGTKHIAESQHGSRGKGPLRLLRTASKDLNISKDGHHSKFQCLPPSSQSIGLRWAHSPGISEAAFGISAPLLSSVTEPKPPGPQRTGLYQSKSASCSLENQALLTANKVVKFYKERKLKKIINFCILLHSPCGQLLNQYLN